MQPVPDSAPPLHVRSVDRPELRERPEDPTALPTDRLELYFVMRKEVKHLLEILHSVIMSSAGARDGAQVLATAAKRFAATCQAFADADPQPRNGSNNGNSILHNVQRPTATHPADAAEEHSG
jgi:hypothetical protein